MRRVVFDPALLTGDQKAWWTAWQKRADAATKAVIRKWEATGQISSKKDFQPDVWGELKDWLLENVFDMKCAYCETKMFRQNRSAEHYRPKAGVNYRVDGKPKPQMVKATVTRGSEPPAAHPGYFWLAYNWRNLVPSCDLCNSQGGKNNQFPVQRQHQFISMLGHADVGSKAPPPLPVSGQPGCYYPDPAHLDTLEEPLLLHPYVDEPRQHLVFGDRGLEAAREIGGKPSPKGVHSIAVFDLKNPNLREAREIEQKTAESTYLAHFMTERSAPGVSVPDAKTRALRKTLELAIRRPFFAAVRDWIEAFDSSIGRF